MKYFRVSKARGFTFLFKIDTFNAESNYNIIIYFLVWKLQISWEKDYRKFFSEADLDRGIENSNYSNDSQIICTIMAPKFEGARSGQKVLNGIYYPASNKFVHYGYTGGDITFANKKEFINSLLKIY